VVNSAKALAGLGIAVGAVFLIFGEYKVIGTQFTLGGGFQYWIGRFLQDGAYPFMVPVSRTSFSPMLSRLRSWLPMVSWRSESPLCLGFWYALQALAV
jgi:hypothetical protein